ncbi:(+)-delta-cadinene synthase [Hibiscus syriacus]|uniref:(+)-delta-cadinene synthase n=1 Tax=Hibiscus syriacus TaxID=106335 RepID=A0A6A2YL94_HIBSY|nr:(+)-delta-cadinene synthase [Hibiscus syriacus]
MHGPLGRSPCILGDLWRLSYAPGDLWRLSYAPGELYSRLAWMICAKIEEHSTAQIVSKVSQVHASPVSSNSETRPKANFHPSIWRDVFLNCPDKDIDTAKELRYKELKEEVRRMLVETIDNSKEKLSLIDAVQRLGVNYHFEKEIEDALEAIYHDNIEADNDLHTTTLLFRLLREHALMFHVKDVDKSIAMASIVDDTYDELIPYTDAIERFHENKLKGTVGCYEEMEQLMAEQGRQYRVEYARKAMIRLAQAYLLEAKWTHQNYKPTFKEFRDNALQPEATPCLPLRLSWEWEIFMDDIAEHKFKHRREDDCYAIECYMEQYGETAKEAYDEFNKHIESSWKDVNEEFLKPTEMTVAVLNKSLNLARVMDVLYREGDGYTHVGKADKGGITSLLIELVPL